MSWVFINQEFVKQESACLLYNDLSIQRGYGVFDFFRVTDFIPAYLDDHLDRLQFSADEMRLKIPYSRQRLKDIIFELVRKNQIPDCGIKITLTGGYTNDGFSISSPNLVISHHLFQPPDQKILDNGIKLVTWEHQRQLPHIKSIDYLMAIWLQPFILKEKADDVLYHQNGFVTECPRSNFFIVTRENQVVTPKHHILKGITRKRILETIGREFEVLERPVSLEDIQKASEAFISSTTKLIVPVQQIDEHSFKQKPKPVSAFIRNLLIKAKSTV